MIKRSFFTLSKPGLPYEPVEPDPKPAETLPIPSNLILLINEPIDGSKKLLLSVGDEVKKGDKLCLYEDSTEYAISPVTGTIKSFDSFSNDFGSIATFLVIHSSQHKAETAECEVKEEMAWADEFLRMLPGAPPMKTLADDQFSIKTLVINCADTDILCSTQQYVAAKHMAEVKEGAQILKRLTQASQVCISMPDTLMAGSDLDGFTVFKTDPEYPQQPANT